MGASPKTTNFLKECMADALLQLMKENQYSKITIKDISDAAGVNRSTWFRNFNTKNDALTFKLIQLWHRWADEHGMKERYRYTLDNAETFFLFNDSKLATTSSTGGLILPLQRGIVTARPEGRCRKHYYWSAYKAVLRESSFLDSSACSFIYFCTASSVILPIVST